MKLIHVLIILLINVSFFTTALCQDNSEILLSNETTNETISRFIGFYRKLIDGKMALYHISNQQVPIYKEFNGNVPDVVRGDFYRKVVDGKMALYHISNQQVPIYKDFNGNLPDVVQGDFYRKVADGKMALYHISNQRVPIYKDFNGNLSDVVQGDF